MGLSWNEGVTRLHLQLMGAKPAFAVMRGVLNRIYASDAAILKPNIKAQGRPY